MVKYFSLPVLFISFRETIEACLIISILIQILNKLNLYKLKKAIWHGVWLGCFTSILLGICVIVLFHKLNNNIFSGTSKHVFEGIFSILAALFIGFVALIMTKILHLEKKIEHKLTSALHNTQYINYKTILGLAFTAVTREGIESVILIGGVSANYKLNDIPIPAITGVLLGLLFGYLIYKSGSKCALHWFCKISTLLLMFIGAGVFTYGMHELQEAGTFGTWKPKSERPIINKYVWDISNCCSDKKNDFFALMRSLFGYQDKPTLLEIISYIGYWIIILLISFIKQKRATLNNINELENIDSEHIINNQLENGIGTEIIINNQSENNIDDTNENTNNIINNQLENGITSPSSWKQPEVHTADSWIRSSFQEEENLDVDPTKSEHTDIINNQSEDIMGTKEMDSIINI